MDEFIKEIVTTVFTSIASKGIKAITKSNRNKYQAALYDVIQNSLTDYESKYPIKESSKTPFYKSKLVLEELMKIRLSPSTGDKYDLVQAVKQDSRILIPTDEDIKNFMEILESHIKSDKDIKELNTKYNYKEEIFTISKNVVLNSEKVDDVLNEMKNMSKELASLKDSMKGEDLESEWNSQLEEIEKNLSDFKPSTALERVKNLESRIASKKLDLPQVKASLSYIKALCLMELYENDANTEISSLFINAYEAFPLNNDYKMYAAHSYLEIKNIDKAQQLINELLKQDSLHIGAWSLKCYMNENTIREFIKQEVPKEVIKNRSFRVQIDYWLLQSKRVRISEIETLGLGLEILDSNEPEKITYKNKTFWMIYAEYMFHKVTDENQLYSVYGYSSTVTKSPLLFYSNDLFHKIYNAVKSTEIEKKYAPVIFLYHYTNFLISGSNADLYDVENLFKTNPKKTFIDVFRMIQVYNTINTKESRQKAIKLVNEFGEEKSDILCLCNSDNYHFLEDMENCKTSFFKYLNLRQIIGEMEAFNIMSRLQSVFKKSPSTLEEISLLLQNKQFELETIKKIIGMFISSLYSTGKDGSYKQLLDLNVDEIPTDLRKYIGNAMIEIGNPLDAVNYFKKYVDTNTPSVDLKLYCEALYQSGYDSATLIAILKNWRESHKPDYMLFNMELELYRLQADWEKAQDVAEQGINYFPEDEGFLTALFCTAQQTLDIATVQFFASKATLYSFKYEGNAISVANVLLWAGFFEDSLNVIFQTAQHEKNTNARLQYIYLSGYFPLHLFKKHGIVAVNSIVKYKIGDKTAFLEITEENFRTFPANLLLNKSVNDTFLIPNEFNNTTSTGIILGIYDRYEGLREKIIEDSKDPMSGIKIDVIDLKENESIEEINKKLIDLYGANGSLEKIKIQDAFQNYYNNEISFTDISQIAFDGKLFEAYDFLTSKASTLFKALPPVFGKNINLHNVTGFILDATSICFFWRLNETLNIQFKHKFIISTLLREELKRALAEEQFSRASTMGLSITQEDVIPHFYPESHKADRIQKYESLLNWIEQSCTVVGVTERLNLLLKEKNRVNPNGIASLIIDNILLSERPNHVLLTNDFVYFKYFPNKTATIISPELYLRNFISTISSIDYSRFVINKKHVGISIDRTVFNEELTKMLMNTENNFLICLANLRFDWNPNKGHIFDVVFILKWLYLESWIPLTSKNTTAQRILSSFLTGMNPQFIPSIRKMLGDQFLLIPDKQDEVVRVFNDVLTIKGFQ